MSKTLLHNRDWIFRQRFFDFWRIGLDRIDIAQVSIILLFLFQFDNRTARSTKIPLRTGLLTALPQCFQQGIFLTPCCRIMAAMDGVMDLYHPHTLNAVHDKKTAKSAPF